MDAHAPETIEEARQYLENFWVPVVGSNVRRRKTLPVLSVEHIEPAYPEQVLLQGKIAYAQDLEWVPSPEELQDLFKRAGIKEVSGGLQLGHTFQPQPQDYIEAAGVLRTYRQLRLMTDGVDPYQALVFPNT
jgi:hypothetical protein